jgi:hypothetical protein
MMECGVSLIALQEVLAGLHSVGVWGYFGDVGYADHLVVAL